MVAYSSSMLFETNPTIKFSHSIKSSSDDASAGREDNKMLKYGTTDEEAEETENSGGGSGANFKIYH